MRRKNQGRDNPIVQASLGNGEDMPALQMRTAVVTATDKTVAPWTVTIRLGDLDIDGITMAGWYDPRVGDVVKVAQQGSDLWVLGSLAPGQLSVATPIVPTVPGPPVVAAASNRRTITVYANSSSSWRTAYAAWYADRFIQGGAGLERYVAYWFYGTDIADAVGPAVILSGSIFVKRASGGPAGVANVRVGIHNLLDVSLPGALVHTDVAVLGTLRKEQGRAFNLSTDQIAALNAGARGLGLDPGEASYLSADYMPAYGRDAGDWSGSLSLTVEGDEPAPPLLG